HPGIGPRGQGPALGGAHNCGACLGTHSTNPVKVTFVLALVKYRRFVSGRRLTVKGTSPFPTASIPRIGMNFVGIVAKPWATENSVLAVACVVPVTLNHAKFVALLLSPSDAF